MTTTTSSLPLKMRANRRTVEIPCSSCGWSLQLDEEVYACADCDGFHHLACWTATGSCTSDTATAPTAGTANDGTAPFWSTHTAVRSPVAGHAGSGTRSCPVCAETINAAARRCRHCGHFLAPALAVAADIAPPELHWRPSLLLTIVTFGLFLPFLAFWQAGWAKKVDHASRAVLYYASYAVSSVIYAVLSNDPEAVGGAAVFYLIATVFFQCGNFSLRRSIEFHSNGSESGRVSLSGVATFFFGPLYFQYHFTRIRAQRNVLLQAA